jgi:hypothetical protein
MPTNAHLGKVSYQRSYEDGHCILMELIYQQGFLRKKQTEAKEGKREALQILLKDRFANST